MDLDNLGVGSAFHGLGPDLLNQLEDEENEKKEKKKSKAKKKQEEEAADESKHDMVHIRVQQRNGRKCITTVQGLNAELDLKKILKAIKKAECCNGTVVEDDNMGHVLQFQGDQRAAVGKFLSENEIVLAANLKTHGAG